MDSQHALDGEAGPGRDLGVYFHLRLQVPQAVAQLFQGDLLHVAAHGPAVDGAVCRFMKQITLEKLRDCLRDLQPEVTVDPAIAARARLAIERMLAIKP